MTRLNLWDFDDTLAASNEVVEVLAARFPNVPYSDWWRDTKRATQALRETKPFVSMWRTLARTPGRHVLFSGRAPAAVEAWLVMHADDPRIGPAIAKLEEAVPVPQFRRAGERIPDVKLRLIRALVADGERDVHLYDDHADLPAMVEEARIPGLTLHRVAHGQLVNGYGCRCAAHRSGEA